MRHILLGMTGSVATVLAPKLVRGLQEQSDKVTAIMTQSSKCFYRASDLEHETGIRAHVDKDEWPDQWKKGDPVLHIDLRKQASALVIAPISANTLAKIANGLCDNLLTSVARAWDFTRPFIIAPAMNTLMWQHRVTKRHIETLRGWGVEIVSPQSKVLACKDEGEGAMAEIREILYVLKNSLCWAPPLYSCSGVPVDGHPGSFGVKRKHSHHTGLDLYTEDHAKVYAVESGRVVNVERFTGPQDNSPWWNDTDAILVEGPTGVICYGEVEPMEHVRRDAIIRRGQPFAFVKRVLKEGKERLDIPGHSTSMLHLELYPHGTKECSKSWKLDQGKPDDLLDPTPYLFEATDLKKLTGGCGQTCGCQEKL